MRRSLALTTITTTLLILSAVPAFAHAGFVQGSVPADSDQTLSLRVPGERPGQATLKVETLVPKQFEVESCIAPPGFTCTATERTDGSTVVVYERPTGVADAAVLYSMNVHTPAKLGAYEFPTIQTYNGETDGETEARWVGDLAPVLEVTAQDTPVSEGEPAPEHTEEPDPEPSDEATENTGGTDGTNGGSNGSSGGTSGGDTGGGSTGNGTTDTSGSTGGGDTSTSTGGTTSSDTGSSDAGSTGDDTSTTTGTAAPVTVPAGDPSETDAGEPEVVMPDTSDTTAEGDSPVAALDTTDAGDEQDGGGVLLPLLGGLLLIGGAGGVYARKRMAS